MFRYFCVIWNRYDQSQCATAALINQRLQCTSSEWQSAFVSDGICVLHAGAPQDTSRIRRLKESRGVVVGTLFRKADYSHSSRQDLAVGELTEFQSESIGRLDGLHLRDHYWGQYVAFVVSKQRNQTIVVNNPVGGLPCYRFEFRGVNVFFSSIEDCVRLGLFRFSINWQYVASDLAIGRKRFYETALNEVTEIYPGERVEVDEDGRTRRNFYWSPLDIVRSDQVTQRDYAAKVLRHTVKACVHAWAATHPRIVHRLSGGLDSSIVLGCLADAPSKPNVTCITYFWPGVRSADERPYARLVAKACGVELVERERTPRGIRLSELEHVGLSVNPHPDVSALETLPHEREIARLRGATAVFNGDPGDNLFCKYEPNFAVADYLSNCGVDLGLLKFAASVARHSQTSVWKLLRDAVGDCSTRRASHANIGLTSNRALANPELVASVSAECAQTHPWFAPMRDVAPGKLLHIRAALVNSEPFYPLTAQAGDPETVGPLRSQPIVELCLQIPTYIHLYDGRNRSLARQAFAPDVPREILTRYWKGRPGRITKDALNEYADVARRLLLDGILMRRNLLNRPAVEEALAGGTTASPAHEMAVFDLMLYEAWARRWEETQTDVAKQAVA